MADTFNPPKIDSATGRNLDPALALASERIIPQNPNPEADRSTGGIASKFEAMLQSGRLDPDLLASALESESGGLVHQGSPHPDLTGNSDPRVHLLSESSGSEPDLYIPDVARRAPTSPRMDGPPLERHRAPSLSPSSIEANEEAQQRQAAQQAGRAPAGEPAATEGPATFRVKDSNGQEREVSAAQVELALRLADRSSRIDEVYEQRHRELEMQQAEIDRMGQSAREGAELRDLAFRDPDRFRQLVEATTGRRLPPARARDDQYDETDDYAYREEGRAGAAAAPPGDPGYVTMEQLQQALKDQREGDFQGRAESEFWGGIDRAASEAVRGVREFQGIEEDVERKIGEAMGRDIRLGVLRRPDVRRNESGSPFLEIRHFAQTYAARERQAKTDYLNRFWAGRVTEHAAEAGSMPAPAQGAATILPGQEQRLRSEEVPKDFNGLMDQITRIADEQMAAENQHTQMG